MFSTSREMFGLKTNRNKHGQCYVTKFEVLLFVSAPSSDRYNFVLLWSDGRNNCSFSTLRGQMRTASFAFGLLAIYKAYIFFFLNSKMIELAF